MKKILIISDTHGHLDDVMIKYAKQVDEVWHAGDIGSVTLLEELEKLTKVRAVYGNIDGADVRQQITDFLDFTIDNVKVCITHIGGYPNKYATGIQKKLQESNPNIFIAGHSHILKVMPDAKNNLLYINPGAIGCSGFHNVRTMITLEIADSKPTNLAVIELNRR